MGNARSLKTHWARPVCSNGWNEAITVSLLRGILSEAEAKVIVECLSNTDRAARDKLVYNKDPNKRTQQLD
ncbi:hypothetical protein SAMD00019534_126380 [Acytostelium subglobosum LB1]|uniref:hypothetical protein n=1 Tax=Acytostelium subglobosum LB1 TaxID=1410327 RepID=UPI000644F515|nr:hypothetical protein SAMD00019534_126380 [Acytostelium subglobosum LB1]GAM29462.1 hypothetical protein SAMD00019534_126380 [Acytostelium subglobosum LB1]|eukprot:XP_012747589.1 hypothetical protein SAMD00019534_126380 [Acytostelium subglobosum LB1]